MIPYQISDATYKIAKQLGLEIFPTDKPDKKIKVYDAKTGIFLFYVGDSKYYDYHTYLADEKKGIFPKGTADDRKRLYHIRHKNDIEISRKSYIGAKLLW